MCDAYETIVHERDFQKAEMEIALEVVRKFIKKHNRILVGGMAIDFALRLKGTKLYPDNKFPDYDFVSPEFHKDAYSIGEELAKQFSNVIVIPAMHASTMKVRLNFQDVADITYVPRSVYDKIPVLQYKQFTIVHPHYQMIDQHRALSMPFESPPRETIFGRWKKDLIRHDLLFKHYPVESKLEDISVKEITVPISLLEDECLASYTSLAYWDTLAEKAGYGKKLLEYKDGTASILFKVPKITLLTEDPDNLLHKIGTLDQSKVDGILPDCKKYNKLLDKVPFRYEINDYEIYDNRGALRSAWNAQKFHVSNLQSIACILLTKGIFYNDDVALRCYLRAHEIMVKAATDYTKNPRKDIVCFLPSVHTYGNTNQSDSVDISKEKIFGYILRQKRTLVGPKPAYPDKGDKIDDILKQYDPTTSPLYQFDGALI